MSESEIAQAASKVKLTHIADGRAYFENGKKKWSYTFDEVAGIFITIQQYSTMVDDATTRGHWSHYRDELVKAMAELIKD